MSCSKIAFPELAWERGTHPLEQKKAGPGATLLSFEPGFADPNWCASGHVGLVLEGALSFELDDGTMEVVAGEGFVIDPGTRHRAHSHGTGRTLLFVAPR